MEGKISAVKKDSPAWEKGIRPGDILRKVNGNAVRDLIEYSFLVADDRVKLEILDSLGKSKNITFAKDQDEDLGISFEEAVFDGVKTCHNKCVFCFVDQMRKGLRPTLYVRDDDYRLSFLYGNFVTLTNLTDDDLQRIIREHLSPLYVSVHATSSEVRRGMMKNKFSAGLMEKLELLIKNGIEIHTQIVLCPEINDGDVLAKSFHDLFAFSPSVLSMAVVPVGLTKFRAKLPQLRLFTAAEAASIVDSVRSWQASCRKKIGKGFIYLSDEFYVLAGRELPPESSYDGYPQLENGIGLSRNFLEQFRSCKVNPAANIAPAVIPVGESAAKILGPQLAAFNKKNKTAHILLPVKNNFFGTTINVTGLLTAEDIGTALKECKEKYSRVILPGTVVNSDKKFLDDVDYEAFVSSLSVPVQVARNGEELKKLLSR